MSAVGLIGPCICLEAISNRHFFNRQPVYRFFKSVTLMSAVGLIEPCICLEIVTFLTVSLLIGFLRSLLLRVPSTYLSLVIIRGY